jgi:hypothetical protein
MPKSGEILYNVAVAQEIISYNFNRTYAVPG